MKELNKHDLAKQLAKSGAVPLTQKAAVDIIETMLDLIVCHFQNGGQRVSLRGFGTFKLRRRIAFEGSNPGNQVRISIPARVSLAFKPGEEVRKRLNTI